jgi:hypothetical protein
MITGKQIAFTEQDCVGPYGFYKQIVGGITLREGTKVTTEELSYPGVRDKVEREIRSAILHEIYGDLKKAIYELRTFSVRCCDSMARQCEFEIIDQKINDLLSGETVERAGGRVSQVTCSGSSPAPETSNR